MLHLLHAFYATAWAIDPRMLEVMETVLLRWSAGVRLDAEQIAAAVGNAPEAAAARREAASQASGRGVAVIPVYGTLTHRAHTVANSSSPMTSAEGLAATIRQAAADPEVGTIVLDIDSPGGSVFGVQELADTVHGLRGQGPRIVAVANATAASGAYWLASQADELVVTPSGMVGSIGVIVPHIDRSKAYEQLGVRKSFITAGRYKAEGNDTGPLDDDARADVQRMVDQYYAAFTKAVARGRNVPVDAVRGEAFGEGRMRLAREAVQAGMADRVDTLDATIARYRRSPAGRTRSLDGARAEREIRILEA